MKHYAALIENIVEMCGYKSFLELGTWTGTVSERIFPLVDRLVGVDIVDRRTYKFGEFYEMSTDEFFDKISPDEKFDCIFVDANHCFDSVKKDLKNSILHLTEHGLILIYDLDPSDPKFYESTGDVYKVRDYIKRLAFETVTMPIQDGGMTLVKFNVSRREE